MDEILPDEEPVAWQCPRNRIMIFDAYEVGLAACLPLPRVLVSVCGSPLAAAVPIVHGL